MICPARVHPVLFYMQVQLPGYSETRYNWNLNSDGPFIDFAGARPLQKFKYKCVCDTAETSRHARARDAVSYVVTEYTLLTPSGVSGTLWNSGATASSLTNVYMLVLTQNWWQVSFSGAATDTDTVSVANSLVRCVPVMHGVSDDGHQYCVPL